MYMNASVYIHAYVCTYMHLMYILHQSPNVWHACMYEQVYMHDALTYMHAWILFTHALPRIFLNNTLPPHQHSPSCSSPSPTPSPPSSLTLLPLLPLFSHHSLLTPLSLSSPSPLPFPLSRTVKVLLLPVPPARHHGHKNERGDESIRRKGRDRGRKLYVGGGLC